MSMQDDLAARITGVRWPDGMTPDDADMFSHNNLRIAASCERVWDHLVDARNWPTFYPNASGVEIPSGSPNSKLEAGTFFRWTTFDQRWDTRVDQFEPSSLIAWYGYPTGQDEPTAYHLWRLTPEGPNSCLVETDEVGIGAAAAKLRKADEGLMHRGHDLWLAGLRFVAEKP